MVNWTDIINAGWELAATGFVTLNLIRTHKDRGTTGVSRVNQLFFASWGLWNLIFYPFNGHWASAAAGALVALVNTTWLLQCIYWDRRNAK